MKQRDRFAVQLDGASVAVRVYRRAGRPGYYAQFSLRGVQHKHVSTKEAELARAKLAAAELVKAAAARLGCVQDERTPAGLVTLFLAETFPEQHPRTDTARLDYSTYVDMKSRLTAFGAWTKGVDFGAQSFDDANGLVQRFLNHRKAARFQKRGGAKGKGTEKGTESRRDKAGGTPAVRALGVRSGTTLDNERRKVQAFFKWLIATRRVSFKVNPADRRNLLLPRKDTKARRPMPREMVLQLLAAARAQGARWYPALLLMVANGMRRAGAARVKLSDLDLVEKEIWAEEKDELVGRALSDYAAEEIAAFKATRFWAEGETLAGVTPAYISRQTTALIKKLFGEKCAFRLCHLRNTFMSMMLEKNVPAAKVAAIAGNSVATIEKHYVAIRRLRSRDEVNAIDLRPADVVAVVKEVPRTGTESGA